MKNWTPSNSWSHTSVNIVSWSSLTKWSSVVRSRTSCLIMVAGTDVLFLVYFRTRGPGFFQLACRPISSVDRPAWTAASKSVTRQEWAVSSAMDLIRADFWSSAIAAGGAITIACWTNTFNHFTERAYEVFSKCCFRSCVIIRVYVGARLITLSFWAHPSTCAKS